MLGQSVLVATAKSRGLKRRSCVQSEAEKELETESKAKKRIRISPFPMFLYFFFLAAMGFYAFVRTTWGMTGLAGGLKGYSIFVLVVELLGAINMLFYGCWLFAKPNNRDIYSQVDESVRLVATQATHTLQLHDHMFGL